MRKRPKGPVAKATTSVAGLDAPVEVRRHPAARRMTLRVSRTKRAVIVTVPVRCNVEDAGSFVNRHIDWVRDRLGMLPEPAPFVSGVSLPVRGEFHTVHFTGVRPPCGVVVEVRPACAPGSEPVLVVHGTLTTAPRVLLNWLQEQARSDLDRRARLYAGKLGLEPKRIAVRDQTSRWGSCSTTKVLSFSWRLILAPPEVLDYVVAHEVAHLVEMNHGPRFWALVAALMPGMDGPRNWLAVYGTELHRYGPQKA